MNSFKYYAPTKILFGSYWYKELGVLLKDKRVLIHYGSDRIEKDGLLDKVIEILNSNNIFHKELKGVVPNPRLSLVNKGIKICHDNDINFILAIGGGSVIDSAKAIGYGINYYGDVWDIYSGKVKPLKFTDVGVILTIAAAGSEMSNSSVITNEELLIKKGYSNDLCRPIFAIMDPMLTVSLPAYQTFAGCTDILMHTMERYFTNKGNMNLTDSLAESLMRTVIKNTYILKNDLTNLKARSEIMWASSLSHNGLMSCGNGGDDFVTHKLEHEVSAIKDVTHGAGLAAIWGSWAKYVYKSCLNRFKLFAINVWNIDDSGSDEEIALKGIEAMESFYKDIDMPISLKDFNITDDDIKLMSHKCRLLCNDKIGAAKELHEEDFINIYTLANEKK